MHNPSSYVGEGFSCVATLSKFESLGKSPALKPEKRLRNLPI